MKNIDWSKVQEAGEFDNPAPGAYIAVIRSVDDVEEKEYLAIEWDFAEGEYRGYNQDTFNRAGFWPTILRKSYKESAWRFFKAFKVAIEASNPGYTFDYMNVQGLCGKRMGIVLGEEEYQKKNGKIGTRPYVYRVRSVNAIQDGDFKIPDLKLLSAQKSAPYTHNPDYSASPACGYGKSFGSDSSGFKGDDEDDGDLPF